MEIKKIWMSQKNLRRVEQIPGMIKTLNEGGVLPPIILNRCEDDEIQVQDGHHRLITYFLSGKTKLNREDYMLIEKDQHRPRFGKIDKLLESEEKWLSQQVC